MVWLRVALPAALAATQLALAVPPQVGTGLDSYERAFEAFVQRFRKTYTGSERQRRFAAFKANYDRVQQHNAKGHSYTLGINMFADLTPQEFADMYGLPKEEASNQTVMTVGAAASLGAHRRGSMSLPSSVDWRNQGAVSSVKNQGQCGACWAFASAGAIEGAWQIATGQLTSISGQQFVDCTLGAYGNNGCGGGGLERTMAYARQQPLANDASYPYEAAAGACNLHKRRVVVPTGGVHGYKHVDMGNDEALMEAIAQQPVAVLIEADQTAFQLYSGGVLSSECDARIDHAVLAVGYGTDNRQDYYLVKNSWGDVWGESGYVRMARGKGRAGECGITSSPPVYAVVDGSKAQPIDITPSLIAGGVLFGVLCIIGAVCLFRSRCRRARGGSPLLSAPARAAPAPAAPPLAAPASVGAREAAAKPIGGTRGVSRLLQAEQAPAPGPPRV